MCKLFFNFPYTFFALIIFIKMLFFVKSNDKKLRLGKNLFQHSYNTSNSILNGGKISTDIFIKENTQMGNLHTRKSSSSLVNKEMQTAITMRCHYTTELLNQKTDDTRSL